MNFLKVKKYAIVFCLSFFISLNVVNAKTLAGLIHTSNSTRTYYSTSINLFEDTVNRSGFSNLLYTNGLSLGQYLNDYFYLNDYDFFDNSYDYSISIFSKSDLNYLTQSYYYSSSGSTSVYGVDNPYINLLSSRLIFLEDFTIDDAFYFIFFGNPSSTNTGTTLVNNTVYTSASVDDDSLNIGILDPYIFVFNSSGKPIGYYSYLSRSGYSVRLDFEFPHDDAYPDMTSWYSYLFKFETFTSDFEKIYPEFFYIDGHDEYVSVSTNAGYSGLSGWFKSLEGDNYDLDSYNMRFIYTDVYYQESDGLFCLFDYWFDVVSYSVPTDYAVLDISKYKKGYYLVPQSGCSVNDYKVYYSGASSLSVYALYFNYYNYSSDDNILKKYKNVGVFSPKAYVNYLYNPFIDLDINANEFSDFAINIYQYSTKYSYLLYYNSSCYKFYNVSDKNEDIFEFSSGSYSFTSVESQENYNNNTVNGSNYVYGSTSVSQGTSSSDVSNSTIISGASNNSVNLGTNVSNIIGNINSYVSGIVSSISALVGIATVFLTGLPAEIYGALLSVFMIGLIIFVIKLIK